MAILWAAYKDRRFKFLKENLSQEDFALEIERASEEISIFMIEDNNNAFDSKRGPVCLVVAPDDGWRIEPHIEFFPWATKRNVLRSSVTFLQWVQYKPIGVCVIKSLEESKTLFDHCRDYGVLFYAGKIIGGDEQGDEYIYSIMGKSNPRRKKEINHGIS